MEHEGERPPVPTVLAISSSVAASRVGLTIMTPALQALLVEVIAIPTVTYGRHPGWGEPGGEAVSPDLMKSMLDGALTETSLASCHWLVTGYFNTAEQIDVALAALERLRAINPSARYLCDPVMGDEDKGLYVSSEVAQAIKHHLVPQADIITPNVWELEYLTDRAIKSPEAAADISFEVLGKGALISSVRDPRDAKLLHTVYSEGAQAWTAPVRERDTVPQGGLGDLLSSLFLGYLIQGWGTSDALAASVGGVQAVLDMVEDAPELTGAGLSSLLNATQPAQTKSLAAG